MHIAETNASPSPATTADTAAAAPGSSASRAAPRAARARAKAPVKTTTSVKPKAPSQAAAAAPRPTQAGDTLGTVQPTRLRKATVERAVDKAQTAKLAAVADIVSRRGQKPEKTAASLKAILDGAAPDDAKAIRNLLRQTTASERKQSKVAAKPDEELNTNWRSGEYPYKNLLSRKTYEQQKYLLQVELLKLQAWAKETGQRIVILFEGRDAAGKGGTIKRMMEHLNPRGSRVVALEKP
ncbi:MAG: polyphosphate kinase 2, partial [Burkholderiaceae bacterium]|nr:polyphosphate kinase 2 [Burkholderiaceae bacterium]